MDTIIPMPAAVVVAYDGETPPPGWLLCDGKTYTKAEYPELYQAIAPVYRSGDTFTVPDRRGRMLLGASVVYALGSTGGEAQHVLTVEEMPTHTHDFNGNWPLVASGPVINGMNASWGNGNISTSSRNAGNAGGSKPHNNMPPYHVTIWIISTGRY